MALKIDLDLTPKTMRRKISRVFELAAPKILAIEKNWNPARGTPVFTIRGKYASRGWTEWTQGFQFGAALLQYGGHGRETVPRPWPRAHRKLMATPCLACWCS